MKKHLTGAIYASAIGAALLAATSASAENMRPKMPEGGFTRAMAVEAALDRFDAADKDGNGILTREEMRDAAEGMRAHFKERRPGMEARGKLEDGPREHKDRPGRWEAPKAPAQDMGPEADARPMAHPGSSDMSADEGERGPRDRHWKRPVARGEGQPGEVQGKDRPRDGARMEKIFEHLDLDGDGSISREEFAQGRDKG